MQIQQEVQHIPNLPMVNQAQAIQTLANQVNAQFDQVD